MHRKERGWPYGQGSWEGMHGWVFLDAVSLVVVGELWVHYKMKHWFTIRNICFEKELL